MTIDLIAAAAAPYRQEGVAALVGVAVFDDLEVPEGSPPAVSALLAEQGFKGGVGETIHVAIQAAVQAVPAAGSRLVVIGMGGRSAVTPEVMRRVGAAFARAAGESEVAILHLGQGVGGAITPATAGQALAEGAALAAYSFDRYRSEARSRAPRSITVVGPHSEELGRGLARGTLVAEAVCIARDLVNEPAGAMTPTRFGERAAELCVPAGVEVSIWDEDRVRQERLGGLLGVARGSREPPRLVRLSYSPPGSRRDAPTVALVGKGITFDSGGLSLKSAEGMSTMKTDMSGAAAVLGAMSVLRRLEVGVKVEAYLPLTENMPGGAATKPGDVLRIRNGKTIEVLNTDAEGRLVLADGLSLAEEGEPAAIIDLATLTGACVVALGRQIAGLMGNSQALIDQVSAASARAGERTWQLPLPEEYREHIESEVADMKNTGAPGQAGALSAGLLLAQFVDHTAWAHLDIAGPARSYEDKGYLRKGATGFGVRTLIELLSSFEVPPAPGGAVS
ncbi:MAG: leucyl aminopeptidase [Acidimicrobiales bacterium]